MTKDLIYLKGELQLWVRKFLVGNSQQCARRGASLPFHYGQQNADRFFCVSFLNIRKKSLYLAEYNYKKAQSVSNVPTNITYPGCTYIYLSIYLGVEHFLKCNSLIIIWDVSPSMGAKHFLPISILSQAK